MEEFLKIVCPHCDTVNRVRSARLDERPKCGRCKQELFFTGSVDLHLANFERTIALNEIPVVVEFWSPSCGYCQMMEPIYRQAAAQLEPRIRMGRVNTQAEPIIAGRFGVQGTPTTVIFKNGREVSRREGVMDLSTLVGWVRYYS
jgi:thioredoxin 2